MKPLLVVRNTIRDMIRLDMKPEMPFISQKTR